MKKRNMLLTLALSLCLSLQAAGGGAKAAELQNPLQGMNLETNITVWMSHANENWDIYMKDLTTGTEKQVTTDPNDQGYPNAWSHYIVWMDNRNWKETGSFNYDIYLYDINTGEEKQISQTPGYNQYPVIKDGKVAWTNLTETGRAVMLYDIAAGTEQKVSAANANAACLALDGQLLAWSDFRSGKANAHIYDLAKGKEVRFTSSNIHEYVTHVAAGKAVWTNQNQIYIYDSKDGTTRKVTSGNKEHKPVAFNGDLLIFSEDGQLNLEEVDKSGTATGAAVRRLVAPAPGTIDKVLLQKDIVIWMQGGTVTAEPVSSVLKRAGNSKEK